MKKDGDFKKYLKNIGEDFYYPIEIFGKSHMNIENAEKLNTRIKELYNCN